jgi:predicted nucleic acid-binding protein
MPFLIDTNVVGELSRREPNPSVLAWAQEVTTFGVSVVTLEEVFFGLAWRPNPRVLTWMEGFLASCDSYPVTIEVARTAGELRGGFQARGRPRTQADMLIGATALVHGLTLVTRNVRDFEGSGVALLDPFS